MLRRRGLPSTLPAACYIFVALALSATARCSSADLLEEARDHDNSQGVCACVCLRPTFGQEGVRWRIACKG